MIELERTFLLKSFPKMEGATKKEMVDCYVPKNEFHPCLRIRKNGDRYEITKKRPVAEDKSEQSEDTIYLSEDEFEGLRTCESKDVEKTRYVFEYEGRTCEIDFFTGALKGLVLVDFEFASKEERDSFEMPDWCLADVTQEDAIAGGMLAGKSYEDIQDILEKYGHVKIEDSQDL